MFVRLWPKKRAVVPVDLKKLAKTFDIVEDPVLTMKSRSVKWGVEGAIALAQSQGEEVNWEKVSSSHARPLSELLGFFEKAKKYAPGIVSIITPSAVSWFLRHVCHEGYLKAIERGDRRSGAQDDDRQGLPRFTSPQWRIATSCYNSL
jgi:hypothetical protein